MECKVTISRNYVKCKAVLCYKTLKGNQTHGYMYIYEISDWDENLISAHTFIFHDFMIPDTGLTHPRYLFFYILLFSDLKASLFLRLPFSTALVYLRSCRSVQGGPINKIGGELSSREIKKLEWFLRLLFGQIHLRGRCWGEAGWANQEDWGKLSSREIKSKGVGNHQW